MPRSNHANVVRDIDYMRNCHANADNRNCIKTHAPQIVFLFCFCLIWFPTSQSTIFQLCWDRSSCVEPVLNKDKCDLLKDTTQWRRWGSTGPSVSSQALYHWATALKGILVIIYFVTLYLLVSSADNFCKQFGHRSGSRQNFSGAKSWDKLRVENSSHYTHVLSTAGFCFIKR